MPHLIFALALIFILSGCGSNDDDNLAEEIHEDLIELIDQKQLSGDPSQGRNLPDINDPLAQLGKKLFFSKGLSGDGQVDTFDTACASCHHPAFAGSDGLSLPYGVNSRVPELIGPGRTSDGDIANSLSGRNSISLLNVGLWDSALNHDGRIESLTKTPLQNGASGGISTPESGFGTADANAGNNLVEAATRDALSNHQMMRNNLEPGGSTEDVINHIVERLRGNNAELATNNWLSAFQIAFNDSNGNAEDLISAENIIAALAAYQRSLVFVDNAWKRYIETRDFFAISTQAKQGALLFFGAASDGKAGCVDCHSGEFFSDEKYHVLALPQIGPGMGDSATNDDLGRFLVTGNDSHRYAFRTPTLLNVARTGPWGHDGAYTSLEDMIIHHFQPKENNDNFQDSQIGDPNIATGNRKINTDLALDQLQTLVNSEQSSLSLNKEGLARGYDDASIKALIAFLETLTDNRLKVEEDSDAHLDCVADWIASLQDQDPDSLRLSGINLSNDSLIGNANDCES